MQKSTRIGLIGYGQIGQVVHKMIDADADNGMEVVFVHDQMAAAVQNLPADLCLADLNDFESRQPDLVVEMAHPDVTRQWGQTILENQLHVHLSDCPRRHAVETTIEETTRPRWHPRLRPHGGVVGMDALLENRDVWESVDVVMKKPRTTSIARPPASTPTTSKKKQSSTTARRAASARSSRATSTPTRPSRMLALASIARTRCCW